MRLFGIKNKTEGEVAMSKNSFDSNSGGIGVFGLLGVAFVVLKLTHFIDWRWWWVTAPFWGGFILIVALFIVVMVISLFVK